MEDMLSYKGYHATVSFDAEDQLFVGEVFGLTDSLNFHGRSVEELTESFHQSVDNYLALCAHFHKNPEKEYKGSFNIRLPKELHRRLALEAAKRKISLNQYIKETLAASVPAV